ncbi:MAG: phage holin family protein [Candidatus Rokuibacteriota bacterium]
MARYENAGEPYLIAGPGRPRTRVLVAETARKAKLLAEKEVELARAELAGDLRSTGRTALGLAVAAGAALAGITLLLVAVVLALAVHMPGWLAAVVVAGITLGASAAIGLIAWSRRVRAPMALTIKTLKDNVRWVKERWA